mmetsp:Transcript_37740/g.87190  ORF Transcript_37740/g.87190 Transcript_37740/m.87190 type:complete len:205 (-) Transcript_37740:40-654(-)
MNWRCFGTALAPPLPSLVASMSHRILLMAFETWPQVSSYLCFPRPVLPPLPRQIFRHATHALLLVLQSPFPLSQCHFFVFQFQTFALQFESLLLVQLDWAFFDVSNSLVKLTCPSTSIRTLDNKLGQEIHHGKVRFQISCLHIHGTNWACPAPRHRNFNASAAKGVLASPEHRIFIDLCTYNASEALQQWLTLGELLRAKAHVK